MIKHVSFDVWNTLIIANPAFTKARTKSIASALNLDQDYVKRAYTQVKKMVDDAAEYHAGVAFSTDEVYQLLFRVLGVTVSVPLTTDIMKTVNQLFLDYPPTIGETVSDMFAWLTLCGITTSIGSNSNFISGNVMHPFLEETLNHYFAFGAYSDLLLAAKPGRLFFSAVINKLDAARGDQNWGCKTQVLHVGDNAICDIAGANEAGFSSLLVKFSDDMFERVKTRIEKRDE